MKRGAKFFEHQSARIEIVPMIDIMMFLLIFFIIITLKMIAGSGIKLELPNSSTADLLNNESVKITVGVSKEGDLVVNGSPSTPDGLKATLLEGKRNGKVDVVVAGDKQVALQHIVKVMDVVRSTGINAIGIATRADPAGAGSQ